ncbi:MAG: hypothetical protein ACI92S_005003 [Planctomycetaceae bacterium]|jgi:hypothetical protein
MCLLMGTLPTDGTGVLYFAAFDKAFQYRQHAFDFRLQSFEQFRRGCEVTGSGQLFECLSARLCGFGLEEPKNGEFASGTS